LLATFCVWDSGTLLYEERLSTYWGTSYYFIEDILANFGFWVIDAEYSTKTGSDYIFVTKNC
jgi:hypothetical protein